MKGGIWIAAGQGLSRYSARRRKRRFFPYEEVKVRTTQVAVLLAEKCKASQHLAKEAHRRHLETKSQGGATCECAKGCVFERIRAVDSDSAKEAC